MFPSFPNAPEATTVSSVILFHCWTEFPGGSVASTAWLVNTTRMAMATPNIERLNRRDFMELSFLIRTSDVRHSRRHKPRRGYIENCVFQNTNFICIHMLRMPLSVKLRLRKWGDT